jgi:acetaldehyde/propanal dehydrogenase
MKKINCVLIGSGNIGTDLMFKLLRSEILNPLWMVGIAKSSDGLKRAREHGMKTTHLGVDDMLEFIKKDEVMIAFDATAAKVHPITNDKLKAHGVKVLDLTPAAIGPYCIPPVNLKNHLNANEQNINMVTCGGQATIPMIYAVSRVQDVDYGEIIATIASKSAGPGTRINIDEFTETTSDAIVKVGGAKKGKAIIILNPAEPPLMMRDTIHCLVSDKPDEDAIKKSVQDMENEIKKYVPGYKIKNGPIFEGNQISIYAEVEGLGDYLPKYAGNLDIMTSAATYSAEQIALELSNKDL